MKSIELTLDFGVRREDSFRRVGLRPMVTGVDLVTICVSSRPRVQPELRRASAACLNL